MSDAKSRFFLDRDDDGHWYVIPVNNKRDWDLWLAQLDEDEADFDVPDFALSVGGHPSLITFENVEFS